MQYLYSYYMYFTYFERVIIKLRNAGNKYPYLKTLCFIATLAIKLLIFLKNLISGNLKKLVSVGALIVMCLVLCPEIIFGENYDDITKVNTNNSETPVSFMGVSVDLDTNNVSIAKPDSSISNESSDDIHPNGQVSDGTVPVADASDIYETIDETSTSEFIPYSKNENLQFSKEEWNLILINKQHPIPDDYEVTLADISKGMKCDERILESLKEMIKGAAQEKINIIVCSPYRNRNRQKNLFRKKIQSYMKEGKTYMEAYSIASTAVTVPGSSEHEAGLAVDLISSNYSRLNAGFADTAAGKWLAEHSWEYGFILRYPKEKEYITGIEYEPWHFRYVGFEAAKYMKENNLCLEELIGDGPFGTGMCTLAQN